MYLGGDESAFEKLYTETVPYAFQIASMLLDKDKDIEDVVQNSYINVYQNLSQLREHDKYYSWLRVIVENNCRQHMKKRVPVPWSGPDDELEAELCESADETLTEEISERTEIQQIVRDAVEKLPKDKRICIELFYFEEADINEIADLLGVPVGTVKTRLFHARKKLEKVLDKNLPADYKVYSAGAIPLVVAMLKIQSKNIVVPAKIAAGAPAVCSAAAGTAAVGAVSAGTAAGVTAAVVVPKVVAVVAASAVAVGGTAAAVKNYKEKAAVTAPETVITEYSDYSFTTETNTMTVLSSASEPSETEITTTQAEKASTEQTATVKQAAVTTKLSSATTAIAATTHTQSVTRVKSTRIPTTTTTTKKESTETSAEVTTAVTTKSASAASTAAPTSSASFTVSNGVLTSYGGSESSVTIPSTVTKVGAKAFYGNTAVKSVTVPSTVTDIGDMAAPALIRLQFRPP